MGGHGGLNILPQKRWNVYNFDNREKVRRDEEAAAKEEQLKREQSRKRDAELRLEKLRQARGISSGGSAEDHNKPSSSTSIQTLASSDEKASEEKSKSDSRHINLFEGIRIFDPIRTGDDGKRDEKKKGKFWREEKKVKKEEVRTVGPEDEKYRMGYGVAGKGVKLPWYMEKRADCKNDNDSDEESDDHYDYDDAKNEQEEENWRKEDSGGVEGGEVEERKGRERKGKGVDYGENEEKWRVFPLEGDKVVSNT